MLKQDAVEVLAAVSTTDLGEGLRAEVALAQLTPEGAAKLVDEQRVKWTGCRKRRLKNHWRGGSSPSIRSKGAMECDIAKLTRRQILLNESGLRMSLAKSDVRETIAIFAPLASLREIFFNRWMLKRDGSGQDAKVAKITKSLARSFDRSGNANRNLQ